MIKHNLYVIIDPDPGGDRRSRKEIAAQVSEKARNAEGDHARPSRSGGRGGPRKPGRGGPKRSCASSPSVAHCLDDGVGHFFGVAEQHERVVAEDRARSRCRRNPNPCAFEDDTVLPSRHRESACRKSANWALRAAGFVTSFAPITARRRPGANSGLTSSISNTSSYGTLIRRADTFMWPGIRPATGWMAYLTLTPRFSACPPALNLCCACATAMP